MGCIVAASKWLGLSLACVLGVALVGTMPVSATDSHVEARLCANDQEDDASLTITSPKSDSVIDTVPLQISGTIHNVTQFDILVDSHYVTTQAVGSNQSTYQTSLSIAQGTHTVELIGNDICAQSTPSDSVVVTYQPAANPGNGDTTPTTVGPKGPSNTSQTVGGSGVDTSSSSTFPPLRAITQFGHAVSHQLDFDTLHGQRASATLFRGIVLLIGVVGVIFSRLIAHWFDRRFLTWPLIALLGLLLIALATFI